jgi:hypothetical protein
MIKDNAPCTCGHIRAQHILDFDWSSKSYDSPLCIDCRNMLATCRLEYMQGFVSAETLMHMIKNYRHEFKLDNLKYLEEMASE